MISSFQRYASSFRDGTAAGDQQYQAILALGMKIDQLGIAVGNTSSQFQDTPTQPVGSVPPPAQPAFNVIGIDGKYKIFITDPSNTVPLSAQQAALQIQNGSVSAVVTPILYNLQSATTQAFDNESSLIDYGISAQLAYEFQDPNVTYFWRIRSSYDGQNWNAWQLFSDPLTCGPTGVWSGLLRSPALVMLNSQAQTVDGSNALTQDGTTTNILVVGKEWNVGPVQITYASGEVDPGTFGTWYIFVIDTQKAGGVVTYLATQNIGDLSLFDGLIAFGFITTSGGGGGTGGGGGSCHVAGTLIDMWNGDKKDCSAIAKNDEMLGCDGGKEIAQAAAEMIANVPCFSLEFANGVKLEKGVSSSEPIMLADGLFTSVFNAFLGQVFKTRFGDSTLITKTFIGNKAVWRQRLSRTKTFWADNLGSHNMKLS